MEVSICFFVRFQCLLKSILSCEQPHRCEYVDEYCRRLCVPIGPLFNPWNSPLFHSSFRISYALFFATIGLLVSRGMTQGFSGDAPLSIDSVSRWIDMERRTRTIERRYGSKENLFGCLSLLFHILRPAQLVDQSKSEQRGSAHRAVHLLFLVDNNHQCGQPFETGMCKVQASGSAGRHQSMIEGK